MSEEHIGWQNSVIARVELLPNGRVGIVFDELHLFGASSEGQKRPHTVVRATLEFDGCTKFAVNRRFEAGERVGSAQLRSPRQPNIIDRAKLAAGAESKSFWLQFAAGAVLELDATQCRLVVAAG